MTDLAELNIRIKSVEAQIADQRLDRLNQTGRRVDATTNRLVRSLGAMAAGFASLRTIQTSIKLATDFDTEMRKITAQVGIARGQVNLWREDLLALSTVVGRTPQELAAGLFFITSAGQSGSQALDTLRKSAMGAAAGFGETQVLADVATSAIQNYGKANIDAGKALGILASTVKLGKAEAASLAPAFSRVIPIASALGVEFDEIGAALAVMTRKGADASQAADSLRQILAKMLRPTRMGQKELAALGISSDDLRARLADRGLLDTLRFLERAFVGNSEAMGKVFEDVNALTGILQILGGDADETTDIFKQLSSATENDLGDAFKEMSSGPAFQFQQALAGLQAVGIQLGSVVLPPLTSALGSVTSAMIGTSGETERVRERTEALAAAIKTLTAASTAFVAVGLAGYLKKLAGAGALSAAGKGGVVTAAGVGSFLTGEKLGESLADLLDAQVDLNIEASVPLREKTQRLLRARVANQFQAMREAIADATGANAQSAISDLESLMSQMETVREQARVGSGFDFHGTDMREFSRIANERIQVMRRLEEARGRVGRQRAPNAFPDVTQKLTDEEREAIAERRRLAEQEVATLQQLYMARDQAKLATMKDGIEKEMAEIDLYLTWQRRIYSDNSAALEAIEETAAARRQAVLNKALDDRIKAERDALEAQRAAVEASEAVRLKERVERENDVRTYEKYLQSLQTELELTSLTNRQRERAVELLRQRETIRSGSTANELFGGEEEFKEAEARVDSLLRRIQNAEAANRLYTTISDTSMNGFIDGLYAGIQSGDWQDALGRALSDVGRIAFGEAMRALLSTQNGDSNLFFDLAKTVGGAIGSLGGGGAKEPGGPQSLDPLPGDPGAVAATVDGSQEIIVINVADEATADMLAMKMSSGATRAVVARGSGQPGVSSGSIPPRQRR